MNCTLTANTSAANGGAIQNLNGGSLTVNNSTFFANKGKTGGGVGSASGGTVTLQNSLLVGNSIAAANDLAGAFQTACANNLIGTATGFTGFTNGSNGNIVGVNGSGTRDPATVINTASAFHGGPTLTFALAKGSPAVNAGSNTLTTVTVDQRGTSFPRIVGGVVDIGALESQSGAGGAEPALFTVTNTNDSGAGSLRQAILDANKLANVGAADRIVFNIPGGGVKTIQPGNDLPQIIDPVILDGTTQPGAAANSLSVGNNARMRIVINGSQAGDSDGLSIAATDCTIRGLVINGFQSSDGISFGRGIVVFDTADRVVIAGNYIGVDAAGTAAVPNKRHGVFLLGSDDSRVGGAAAADRNLISGNQQRGLFANAKNLIVQGNYVGTNASGTAALGNGFEGIFIADNLNVLVGGSGAGEGNLVSGNEFAGITFNAVSNSRIQGNTIGTAVDGVTPLANAAHGVFISKQAGANTGNLIGGPSAAHANLIAFNGGSGILLQNSGDAGNRFQRNRIHSNAELGIDLADNGITANDAGDADAGSNGLQNFPVLTTAFIVGSQTKVTGTLNSKPGRQYQIEFFASPIADGSGNGEGATFLGSLNATTNAGGTLAFTALLPLVTAGQFISATATDVAAMETSEFSGVATVRPPVLRDSEFSVGRDAGGPASVTLFNANGTPRFSLTPFGAGFNGGVRTAAGDFTGDGIADLAVASGPGIPGQVLVFDGSTQQAIATPLPNNQPFGNTFTRGVLVSAGDLNGDGRADLIITAEAGGGARVRVFQSTGAGFTQRCDYIALIGGNGVPDGTIFRGGSRAAVSDLNGDGIGDLIWAAGAGGGPRIATFDGARIDSGTNVNFKLTGDFFALSSTLRDGAFPAGGDFNGDGFGDFVAGGGSGAPPQVVIFSGDTLIQNQFQPYVNFLFGSPNTRQGVRVAAKDLDGDARTDLIVGSAPTAGSHVSGFAGKNLTGSTTGAAVPDFDAFPTFVGGIFVG